MMRSELCVCAEIPRIETKVRLVLLAHFHELKSTTNTGRLASYAFPDSEIRVRGLPDAPMKTAGIVPEGSKGLLLYPSEDAIELSAEFVKSLGGAPITLVVPEGSWRQASKVVKREPGLASLPRIKLPVAKPSEYQLRTAPNEQALCTLEAVALAMRFLDGPEAEARLTRLFQLVVARTMWSRGLLPLEQCREHIPAEAVRIRMESGRPKPKT